MSRSSRWSVVVLCAAILSLGSVGSALAGSSPGEPSDYVTALASGWVHLDGGQSQWYLFHTNAAPSDAPDSRFLVDLAAEPQGSATFQVWTLAALKASQAGDQSAAPVGTGILQTHKDNHGNDIQLNRGDLVWAGTSYAEQDFLIGVQAASASPGRYSLRVSGPYVALPDSGLAAGGWSANNVQTLASILAANTPVTPQPVSTKSPRQHYTGPAVSLATGATPDSAFRPDGLTRHLAAGQQHWYAFKHVGPGSAGNGTTIEILLSANPQGSASFNVWTPDEVQALAAGNTESAVPVGRGSLHPIGGDPGTDRYGFRLEWAGKFPLSGTYYIQVVQTGNAPSSYSLQVSSSAKPK